MKIIYSFILLLLISCNGNNTKSQPLDVLPKFQTISELSQKAHAVNLYLYVPIYNERAPIIQFGSNEFTEVVIDSFTRRLSFEEKRALDSVITNSNPDNEIIMADCYWPHHGIVFYDKEDNIIGHLSICFSCGGYDVSQDGLYINYLDLDGIRAIFKKKGIPTPRNGDFYMHLVNWENKQVKISSH